MTLRAGYFRITWEIQEHIKFLDVEAWKGARWQREGKLDHTAFVKPTSLYRPLGLTSMHHGSVHRSWPMGMVKRLRNRCYHAKDALAHEQRFESKLASVTSRDYARELCCCGSGQTPFEKRKIPPFSRLILPFCPATKFANINRVLKRAQLDFSGLGVDNYTSTAVAWSLGGQHLVHRLTSGNGEQLNDGLGYNILA